MNSYCLSSGEAFLFLIFYSYSVAPFEKFTDEVGRWGYMVCEDDAAFFPFFERRFFLAIMQGKGTQIVCHFLCATDSHIPNWIVLIIVPYPETITEEGIDIYLWIGSKSLWYYFKAQFMPYREQIYKYLVNLPRFLLEK